MDRSTAFSLVDADVHNYPNALVDLIAFVEDMGLPPNVDRDAYESLSNKILDNIQWSSLLINRV